MRANRQFVALTSFRSRWVWRALAATTALAVIAALGLAGVIAGMVAPASATHLRAAQLTWTRTTDTAVRFDLTMSFRRSYGLWNYYSRAGGGTLAAPNPGDIIQDSNTVLRFGDNTSTNPYLRVTSVDAANDILTAEAIQTLAANAPDGVPHTYPNATVVRTAALQTCCRLSLQKHRNNPDKSIQLLSVVNLVEPQPAAVTSPTSSLPPVIDCPTAGPCNFFVPATVPSGTVARYALSTSTEASYPGPEEGFVQPTGSGIDALSGLYRWNTTGQPRAPGNQDTYYSTQITIKSALPNGHVTGSVAVDVFLRITGNNNAAPVWSASTPADGTTYTVAPGEQLSLAVSASDPDTKDVVTLGAQNAPAGTFTQTAGNPATGTFTFTPAAAGTTVVNFTAQDQNGLGATPRSVTVTAAQRVPDLVWPAPSQVVWGTALGQSQLNAAFATAPGAKVPPNPGTFTYTPAAGTVLEPGDQALSMTWTPDPADAAGWAATTMTNTLSVVKADQVLAFDPAIDPSVVHTYGDAAFGVNARASSGLAPSYSVGSGDACVQASAAPDPGVTVSLTGAGTCTLSVDQAGDVHYNPAPQLSHTFTIAQQTPTISWVPGAMTYGQHLSAAQLNASIEQSEAAANGTLAYTVDGLAPDTTATLPAGDHTATVTYTPDAGSPGSNYTTASKTVTFSVAKAAQSITFAALTDRVFGTASFTIAPTSDSGLPVTASSTTPTVCAASAANQVTILHAGTCTITASQDGDNNHLAAASVTRSFAVAKADQTIVFTGPGSLTYGDPDTALTATGGGSALPVTFTATPTGICAIDPTGTSLVIHGAGLCTVTASQAGNDDYNPADDVTVAVTIKKATPTLFWTTPAPIDYGTALSAVQLNATVTPADLTGTIAYYLADGTTPATGAVLNASATPQQLKAVFTPDGDTADNYTSAAASTTIVVNKADQLITINPTGTHTYGDPPFTVTATGGASGNPVTFSTESPTCSVTAAGTVTITAAGDCELRADQAGNGNYNPARQALASLTIAKLTPSLSWDTPAAITYGTALSSTQLNATVTPAEAANNGALAYTTDASASPAAGQTLHAGQHTLTVTYTPNESPVGDNYTTTSKQVQLTVNKAPQSLAFGALPDARYGTGPIALSATPGVSGEPVVFTVESGSACTVSGATLTLTGAGTCTVTASQSGNGDYLPASPVSRTFTIDKALQVITFAPLSDKQVGDPAFTVSASGGASGNPVTFTAGPAATCAVTGTTVTITGPGSCTVTASQSGNGNYADADPVARSFGVGYRVCAISDQTQTNRAGSAVPIKVALCDSTGRSLSNSAIVLRAVNIDTAPASAAGNSALPDNNFRYVGTGGGSYHYNLKTDGLSAGAHTLTWTVTGDPTTHRTTVLIG